MENIWRIQRYLQDRKGEESARRVCPFVSWCWNWKDIWNLKSQMMLKNTKHNKDVMYLQSGTFFNYFSCCSNWCVWCRIMFSSIQSVLPQNWAVRKREESSIWHLFANQEAIAICFRSISGCILGLRQLLYWPDKNRIRCRRFWNLFLQSLPRL